MVKPIGMLNHPNERRYSEHLCVSKTVKHHIINDCCNRLIELNPELEGSKITHNQIITAMIKTYLGIFELDGKRINNKKHKD